MVNIVGKIKTWIIKRKIESAKQKGFVLPEHVGFIPDGNRRFAIGRHMVSLEGHTVGYDKIKELLDWALASGIHTLTLYAFSRENFKREAEEVNHLMHLLQKGCVEVFQSEKIHKNQVRVHFIGNRSLLPPALLHEMDVSENATLNYNKFNLNIAIGYSGRDEITRAVQHIAQDVQEKKLSPDTISEATIQEHLDTGSQKDPDLIIRTSGEQRISGFLIWQGTYSEFCFQKVMFPTYQQHHFLKALYQFQTRNRRFGK